MFFLFPSVFFLWSMNCSNTVGNYGEKNHHPWTSLPAEPFIHGDLPRVDSELPMTWCHGGGKTWRLGQTDSWWNPPRFWAKFFLGKGRIFPRKLHLSFLKRGCFLGFFMFSQVGMARQPGLSIQTWWYYVLAPCVLYIALRNVNEHLRLCILPKTMKHFFNQCS